MVIEVPSSPNLECVVAMLLFMILLWLYTVVPSWATTVDTRTIVFVVALALTPVYCIIGLALDIVESRRARNSAVKILEIASYIVLFTILASAAILLYLDSLEVLKKPR